MHEMMNGMMDSGWMAGMGILVMAVVVLGLAALVKYLFFDKRP